MRATATTTFLHGLPDNKLAGFVPNAIFPALHLCVPPCWRLQQLCAACWRVQQGLGRGSALALKSRKHPFSVIVVPRSAPCAVGPTPTVVRLPLESAYTHNLFRWRKHVRCKCCRHLQCVLWQGPQKQMTSAEGHLRCAYQMCARAGITSRVGKCKRDLNQRQT